MGDLIGAVKLNVLLQTKGSWMKGMGVWLLCYDWRALEQSVGLVGGSERGLVKLCVFGKASEGTSWASLVLGMGASFGQERDTVTSKCTYSG